MPDQLGHDSAKGVRVDAREHASGTHPLGVYRDVVADGYANAREAAAARAADCPIACKKDGE